MTKIVTIDGVLSYHLNPLVCGVAKFNLLLAEKLSIPMFGLFDEKAVNLRNPLVSLKPSEISPADMISLERLLLASPNFTDYVLFLHDYLGTGIERALVAKASAVFCGNEELRARLLVERTDVVALWAPDMLVERQRFNKAELSVFSFGMAHKLRAEHYLKLRELLEESGKSYCMYLSTALHEGTSFVTGFEAAFRELRQLFGSNIYFLGFLSDTAVYNYMLECTFFAAFFPKGVRANNTSIHAAMRCGSVVITNLDEHSPSCFIHGSSVLDIGKTTVLPTDAVSIAALKENARATARHFEWDLLIDLLKTTSAQASNTIA